MISLIKPNFLNRYPIEQAMQNFGGLFDEHAQILDIGCGQKPYAKYFKGTYVGVDHAKETKADIVCDSSNIPLSDETFDAVICNQTLEHTEDVRGTVKEIRRLLKPGGYALISAPLIMKVHAKPLQSDNAPYHNFDTTKIPYWRVDYWRFTKYGLISLCKDFKIVVAKESNGYVGTIAQLINYFFASFGIPYIFIPVYIIFNSFGLILDDGIRFLCTRSHIRILEKFYHLIYATLSINYILIIRKPS